jgi:hypothetical protein
MGYISHSVCIVSARARYLVGQIYHYVTNYVTIMKGSATIIDWLHGMFDIYIISVAHRIDVRILAPGCGQLEIAIFSRDKPCRVILFASFRSCRHELLASP